MSPDVGKDAEETDLVGVGLGPANLSLAALADPLPLTATFIERQPKFAWHPGMMLPQSTVQVSFLKDLVSMADPTSRFSFLNFLHRKGRLYRFASMKTGQITRKEFEQYYAWVAGLLPRVHFGTEVHRLREIGDRLEVCAEDSSWRRQRRFATKNLVVAVGSRPHIPSWGRDLPAHKSVHSASYLDWRASLTGKRVAVVGGGQSGAEVFHDLLISPQVVPSSVIWLTRRPSFQPLDDSPFANELFTPTYAQHFYRLPGPSRDAQLAQHKLTSDGISEDLLDAIYRRLYELDYVFPSPDRRYHLRANCEVREARDARGRLRVRVRDLESARDFHIECDFIVMATGYRSILPEFVTDLVPDALDDRGNVNLTEDFEIIQSSSRPYRIFVQNAGSHSHGIADANLGLNAWRSSRILNAVLGRPVFEPNPQTATGWNHQRIRTTQRKESDMQAPGAPLKVAEVENQAEATVTYFAFPKEEAGDSPPVPLGGTSIFVVDPKGRTAPDRHSVTELWVVAAGTGRIHCGAVTEDVQPGDAFLIGSDQEHVFENTQETPATVVSVWW